MAPTPSPKPPSPTPDIFKVAQAFQPVLNFPGASASWREMKKQPVNSAPARIHAVSISDRKGVVKHNVPSARLLVEHGLEGDAHAEGGIRQVSLLSLQSHRQDGGPGRQGQARRFRRKSDGGWPGSHDPAGGHAACRRVQTCSWKLPRSARPVIRAAPSGSWWATASCPGKASSPGCSKQAW